MTVVRRQAIRQLKRKVSLVVPAEPVTTDKDRLVLSPAGQAIKKPTFDSDFLAYVW